MLLIRGCNLRVAGGIYAMTRVSEYGLPLAHFLYDPTIPVEDLAELGMTERGMTVQPAHDGRPCYDLWDYIGAGASPNSQGYWNVWDYLEEGLRYHFSALVPKNKDILGKLTRKSRRILVHPHGLLVNAGEFVQHRIAGNDCPTSNEVHDQERESPCFYTCVGWLREATQGGRPSSAGGQAVVRWMPAFKPESESVFSYPGWAPPEGVHPQWQTAIVGWLPISHLEVVYDAETSAHEEALKLIQGMTDLDAMVVES